jgi:hypothetical protein
MNDTVEKLTKAQIAEYSKLLGPAPVLSSEDAKHYDAIWEHLLEILKPRDFLELLLMRQILDATWEVIRYTRHKTLGIERRFRQSLEFQAERKKEQKARREKLAQELAEKTGHPIADFAQMLHLQAVMESTVDDFHEISRRPPTELEHNRALEAGILLQEQLDRLINSAVKRRNEALLLLEHYREGLGHYLRRISDQIIDAAATEIEGSGPALEAPPLAPPDEGSPGGSESPTENVAAAAAAPADDVDPLDSTRHWSDRSDVLKAQNRS